MTVLTMPSAGRMRGWRSAVPATLLCAVMVGGCGSSGGAASVPRMAQGTGAQGTGAPVPRQSAAMRACLPWAGLDDLFGVTTWLRLMIGDEVIFGADTGPARRDGLATVRYADSLGGLGADLPAKYARDLRESVLPVAASPYKKTPEQLNTAANDAQNLAEQISQLCI